MSTFKQDIWKYIKGLAKFSGDIFWIKSSDFKTQIYISPAYETIWGRSCDSLYADPKSWMDYVFPEDLERLHSTIEQCRKENNPTKHYTVSYRIKKPDGKVFWIRERGSAIYDENNQLIGFGGVTQDVTSLIKNQKVEQEVKILSAERDSYEEYLKSIVDSIAGNHWWKDRKGVYRGYNRALLKSLGYNSPSDIIGKTDYELPWAENADELVAHDLEVMRRGVSIEREEVVTNTHGQKRIYLVNKAPLRDSNGEIIGTIGHGFDITDIKKAQKELEQSRLELEERKYSIDAHLSEIIESMGGNHWLKNLSGQYIVCNNHFAKECGLNSSEEMKGKTDYELPWSYVADEVVRFDREVIEKEKITNREQSFLLLNGQLKHYIISRAPLRDSNNNIIGIMGTALNITEQKQREKRLEKEKKNAEELSQSKSLTLSLIANEVRTPLNSILGAADIIRRKFSDPTVENYINDITSAANSLLSLVKNAQDSFLLKRGDYKLKESSFNVHDFIESVAHDVNDRYKNQSICVKYAFIEDVPEVVIGDSFRLRQVLTSLVDVFGSFLEVAEINISISCEFVALTTATLLFEIKPSISNAVYKKLIKRFSEIDSEEEVATDQLGVNLSVCKNVVEAMGGEIQADDDKERGMRFWFSIPFRLKIDAHQGGHKVELSQTEKPSVLLVEDDVLNQKVTKALLEDLECDVDIASNAKDALACIEQNNYHIIFMDIGLPEENGITLTEHIRSNSETKNMIIIGLTARATEEDIQRCYDARMNDVLTKPVTLDELKKTISHFFVLGELV